MKLNRKILMVLSIVLSLALTTGGTLAYLTDRDATANVFTVGDVDITLNEEFQQGAELIPGVDIKKVPTITNTGKNDAWVWMTFSIPADLDNWNPESDQGSNSNIIHWNPLGATTLDKVTDTRVANAIAAGYLPEGITAQEIIDNKMVWDVYNDLCDGGNCYQEDINGVKYNTYVLPYQKALTSGETTLPSLYNVYLDSHVDIDPEGNMYRVEKGVATDLKWNINTNGGPVIYVSAYATQAEGFASVDEAYAAYNEQWTTDAGVNNGLIYGKVVNDQAALDKAIADGEEAVQLGSGTFTVPANSELNIKGAGESTVVNFAGTVRNTNLENVRVTADNGEFRIGSSDDSIVSFKDVIFDAKIGGWSSVKGEVVMENCTFNNTGIHFDVATGAKITINESTFGENCKVQIGAGAELTIKNSTFETTTETSLWSTRGMRFYSPTTFENCEFNNRWVLVGEDMTLSFNNCTMNGGEAVTFNPNLQEGLVRGGNVPKVTIDGVAMN